MIVRLKEDIYRAQRMYYLSLKLRGKVPSCLSEISRDILNDYTRLAKEMDLKLTSEELYSRLLDE